MALSSITVAPLGRQHDRAAFHCGSEALDRYLKQQARQEADEEGMPYQTLIASVLHKYVTGRLVEPARDDA